MAEAIGRLSVQFAMEVMLTHTSTRGPSMGFRKGMPPKGHSGGVGLGVGVARHVGVGVDVDVGVAVDVGVGVGVVVPVAVGVEVGLPGVGVGVGVRVHTCTSSTKVQVLNQPSVLLVFSNLTSIVCPWYMLRS